jgi:hypothetical protein
LIRRSHITKNVIYAQQPCLPHSRHSTYTNDDGEYDEAKFAPGPRGRQDDTCPDDAERQKLRDRVETLERQAREYNERYDTATETVAVLPRTFAQAVSTPSEPHTDREIEKEKTTAGSSKNQRGSSKDQRGSSKDERRQANGDPNRRKTQDRPSPNDDDDGSGEDDDPKRGKNDINEDIKREDRKPDEGHPGGVAVEVEVIQVHHQTMTMMQMATSRLTGTDLEHVAYNQVTPNRPARTTIDRN